MQKPGRLTTLVLAVGLVLGTAPVGMAGAAGRTPGQGPRPAAAGPSGASAGAVAGARPVSVTLLTGDRVTVTGSGAVAVRPGPGRAGTRFLTSRAGGRLSVVPQDAVGLLRSGRVDRRLFDVTGLVEAGYDDARRADLPLVVTFRDRGARRVAPAVAGLRTVRDLPAVGGAAVRAAKDSAGSVWSGLTVARGGLRVDTAGGVDRVWLDGRRRVSLDRSVPQIGAPAAHAAGWTGQGVSVAVLDTGVDVTHPDLAARVTQSVNFSAAPDAKDNVGHGTHVASTIAGSGAASGGRYRGVAPDATILSGKVCEDSGCSESAILAGMQWAAVERGAKVVNLSLGGMDLPGLDPLEEAVNTLTAQTGALFVIAAGNDGAVGSVGSPASAQASLAVGAVDFDDELAGFSSRGPRVGDDGLKPDITAPGVDIVAARGAGTELGEPVGTGYVTLSGTSMATPHVAGAAALLAQQHPGWVAGQVKAALMASAKPHPGQSAYEQGAGRVDVARAVAQQVTTDPVGVSFGRAIWPHGDDAPIARTLTYRNPGATALTLALTVQVTGPSGAAAPAGMFTLDASSVTVPAGGQAQVTITADTSVTAPDGFFTGRVLARSGELAVVTPLAVNREVESYQVTIEHRDQNGALTETYGTTLLGLDAYVSQDVYDPDGIAEVRVPKGRYGLASLIWIMDDEGDWGQVSLLAQPELVLDRNTELTIDARRTRPVRMTVPDPAATPALVDLGVYFNTEEASYGFGVWADDYEGLRSGQLGGRAGREFVATIASQWADWESASSPYLYALSEVFAGRMPDGFVRHYRPRDLATVTHRFRGGDQNMIAERLVIPDPVGHNIGVSAIILPIAFPGQRVEYYNTNGMRWTTEIDFGRPSDDGWLDVQAVLQDRYVKYQPGRRTSHVWNTAPYGPSFPAPRWPDEGISRQGDDLTVSVPLHSDAAGNAGGSRYDSARTALYRNGNLVGEFPEPGYGDFEVPPAAADYRLETLVKRSFTDLSTEVGAAWTFRSGHTAGDGYAKLPAMAVRFSPALDDTNTAPAGRRLEIPVTVERQPGAPASKVKALTVQVSYDGGRTWQDAPVKATGPGWSATVTHPAGSGHASLRATATDRAGNTVTQHIINAYRLA